MTAATAWGSANVIKSCRRCGRAAKVRRDHVGPAYCTEQCRTWDRQEATALRVALQATRHESERRDRINGIPLHTLYPGMVATGELVQTWRPSYTQWAIARIERMSAA